MPKDVSVLKRPWRFLSAAFFVFAGNAFTPSIYAQSNRDTLQNWINQQSVLGEQIGRSLAVEAGWTTNLRIPLDAATIEALSRDLSKFPHHPLHGRQQQVRDQAEKGIDMRRYIAAGDDRWRMASIQEGPEGSSWHSGGSSGDSWMWHETEVTIVDAKRPPHGRNYPDMRYEYLIDLLKFMTGGLADIPPRTRSWRVVEHSVAGWKAVATSDDPPLTLTAIGGWDAAVNKGVVHSVTVDGAYPSRTTFTDWKDRDGFWTAGTIRYDGSSGYKWINVLAHISTPSPSRIAAISRTPAPGKTDPLFEEPPRGAPEGLSSTASPVMLVDLRGDIPSGMQSSPAGVIPLQATETPRAQARRHFRWAGWAVGGSLAMLIGIMWWKARSASR